jgi:hypothetical protein
MKLQFTVYEDLIKCTDSLLFNSETTIAKLEVDDYCLCLEVQGEVRIVDNQTQEVYKTPSEFPQELKDAIKSGDIFEDLTDRYYVDNNNWFNATFFKNNKKIDDDVWELEFHNYTEFQLLEEMMPVFEFYKSNN